MISVCSGPVEPSLSNGIGEGASSLLLQMESLAGLQKEDVLELYVVSNSFRSLTWTDSLTGCSGCWTGLSC